MNHGGRSGSRGRSPASGQMVYRQKSESPVTVDRSLNESSGNRGRGSRGRGRCTPSWSPRNSSGYANDERSPEQVYVKKSSQEINSQDDGIGSTKQPYEGAALNFSGDRKDLLQSSISSSSKNINGGLSISRECGDKDVKDVKDCARVPYDLLNRMKDVSMSSQEFVSSTSDHKIKVSSVEDHNIVHNSGSAGKSSNEGNLIRFDIFLEKTVFALKPSLKVLNKEKKRASKGYSGIVIRPGMVLLKNYLSINDQVMIVNKCRQLGLGEGGFYQPRYRDGATLHLKMMCLGKNWDPETSQYGETRLVDKAIPPKIPIEFNQFVEKAIEESQSLVATTSPKKMKGEYEIPFIKPDICIVNFYTSTGNLGLHQDKDESEKSIQKGLPVVSFSIGDTAEFLYGDERYEEKAEMVELESGDVLIFGGKSRNIFHGVRSIVKDTAPTVLAQETSVRPGRLNLTFRQY